MKHLFFMAILALSISTAASGQTFKPVSTSGGFNVETGTATDSTFTVDGQTFQIFQTGKGSKYIKCKSARTGNLYPVWIGTEASYEHDGRKVYQSKKGSFCIYKLSAKTGNPYPVWLRME